jgi:hypothetical protein
MHRTGLQVFLDDKAALIKREDIEAEISEIRKDASGSMKSSLSLCIVHADNIPVGDGLRKELSDGDLLQRFCQRCASLRIPLVLAQELLEIYRDRLESLGAEYAVLKEEVSESKAARKADQDSLRACTQELTDARQYRSSLRLDEALTY